MTSKKGLALFAIVLLTTISAVLTGGSDAESQDPIQTTSAVAQQSPEVKKDSKPWRSIIKIKFEVKNGWFLTGSAVMVRPDIALTANLLVRDDKATTIVDGKPVTGKVIYTDAKHNLALVQFSKRITEPLVISQKKPEGNVWLFGHGPKFGAITLQVGDGNFFCPIKPNDGDLGGPILNKDGQVVGLYTDYHHNKLYGFDIRFIEPMIKSLTAPAPQVTKKPPPKAGKPTSEPDAKKLIDDMAKPLKKKKFSLVK